MSQPKVVICPYCGETQPASERCSSCGGLFESLSRQATHNAMGPWFVRDGAKPFHPGCSYETLARMVDRGQVTKHSILRGPTTKQFWTVAKHAPGVAHLLGYCHNCDAPVDPADHGCHACGVPFGAYLDRNNLGLPDLRPLPGKPQAEAVAGGMAGSAEALGVTAASKARGGSISRFATDEELLAPGSGVAAGAPTTRLADPPYPQPEGGDRARAHAAADPGGADGKSVFDDYASSTVTRALRRKLAGQQQTIRLLTMLLIVVLVITVGVSLGPLAAMLKRGAPAPAAESATGPDREVMPEDQAPSDDAAGSGTVQTELPSDGPGPATEPESDPAAAAPESLFDAEYARALQLITSADQSDRQLDQRIDEYERALQSLQEIDLTAPTGQKPQDLTSVISRISSELERLRLRRDFFG